jgi:glycosyltransferase involved in cell wall biosynthesis
VTARPLRILHVAGSAQWAGGEVFLKHMADGFDPQKILFGVVCPERGPLQNEMARRGISCGMINLAPLGSPLPIFKLKSYFKKWKPDVVQSHGARSNFYARWAAGKIPHISTVHNSLADYNVPAYKKKLYAAMDAVSAGKSRRLVFIAEDLKKKFLEQNPKLAPRSLVIYNGIDFSAFDPHKFDRGDILDKNRLPRLWTLGIVGRLTPQKGHIYLLEALARARKTLPPFQLLIVGDGPLRRWLENQVAALGLRQQCRFLGVREDVAALLSVMDVVVVPSVSEGLPYVIIEALAMGKPVVASLVNGVGEILKTKQEAYGVPPRDPQKIIDALGAILHDPQEAQKRARKGQAAVRETFDVKRFLINWENLYRMVVREKRPA